VSHKIIRYSNQFCKLNFFESFLNAKIYILILKVSDDGLNYQNALNLSLLCVSWSKINYYDKELQDKIVDSLIDIQDSLNHENIQEICKILWSLSNSEYTNGKLIAFINKFIRQEAEKLSVNNLIDILLSVGFIYRNEIDLISYLLQVKIFSIKSSNFDKKEHIKIIFSKFRKIKKKPT